MNTYPTESKPDIRTRAERRQRDREIENPRTYLAINKGGTMVRSRKGKRLPFDEFKHASRSHYEPHVGLKQLSKALHPFRDEH